MRRVIQTVFAISLLVSAQQVADPNFDTKVAQPAYATKHPVVVIDEAHHNFHTASGRYKPFADLLHSDGYTIAEGKDTFDKPIHGNVLIIANALGAGAQDNDSAAAFTAAECDALYKWVRNGGALLLIADHTPFGSAAAILGERFGVNMGKGFAMDSNPSNIAGSPSVLLYSDENKLLGDHAIMRGRNDSERIHRVVAFTGQSLGVPQGATVLMRLGPDSFELANRAETQNVGPKLGYEGFNRVRDADAAYVAEMKSKHGVAGRAQGLAFKVGKGRVVVMGEAAMFSAQVIKFEFEGKPVERKMGMNVEGSDDRQFALNVLHWLSGLLN